MAEPFKNLIHRGTVEACGHHLERAWPAFDRPRFERLAMHGLEALEMKARAMHIADALEATLPRDFDHAAGVIEAALGPPVPLDAGVTSGDADGRGLAGWIVWPLGELVSRAGIDHPERALACLHALTQRLTAEFAIRRFVAQRPEVTFATLRQWVRDPSAHVRRLVSEGSRPRLPWGLQLKALIADPTPTLPLLEALQDDASEYVRRSVANHLNDIAKDHPELIVAWLERWLPNAGPERRALLRHACRSLIKSGHPQVLAHWGAGAALRGDATLRVAPGLITVGGSLDLELTLRSRARSAQALVIDYVVHHVKADGRLTPKVFKGWTVELAPGATLRLAKRHSMRAVTTRRYHAGRHGLDVQVNGRVVASAGFDLRLAP